MVSSPWYARDGVSREGLSVVVFISAIIQSNRAPLAEPVTAFVGYRLIDAITPSNRALLAELVTVFEDDLLPKVRP